MSRGMIFGKAVVRVLDDFDVRPHPYDEHDLTFRGKVIASLAHAAWATWKKILASCLNAAALVQRGTLGAHAFRLHWGVSLGLLGQGVQPLHHGTLAGQSVAWLAG